MENRSSSIRKQSKRRKTEKQKPKNRRNREETKKTGKKTNEPGHLTERNEDDVGVGENEDALHIVDDETPAGSSFSRFGFVLLLFFFIIFYLFPRIRVGVFVCVCVCEPSFFLLLLLLLLLFSLLILHAGVVDDDKYAWPTYERRTKDSLKKQKMTLA